MKYMFASDIHGSAYYCKKTLEVFEASGAKRLILLGDLLYHGPRNDLPKEYAPKQVIAMSDYALLELNGKTFYATHGHIHNADALPPMQAGDILIHGHTHLLKAEPMGDKFLLNPGSTSLAKGGNPNTYGMLDENVFTIYDFDGNVIKEITL